MVKIKKYVHYFVYICIVSFCVSICIFFMNYATQNYRLSKIRQNMFDSSEIFIANQSISYNDFSNLPSIGFVLDLHNKPIDFDEVEKIRNINGVEYVNPEFSLMGSEDGNNIDVDGKKYGVGYTVKPYYEYQNLKNYCTSVTMNKNGIYLSYFLAKELNIDLSVNKSIEMSVVYRMVDENDQFVFYPTTIQLPISGILEANYYELGESYYALVPNNVINDKLQIIDKDNRNSDGRVFDWFLYRVKLKNETYLTNFREELNNISDSIKIGSSYQYQKDIGNYFLKSEVKTSILPLLISIVIFLGSSYIYKKNIRNYGLSKKVKKQLLICNTGLETLFSVLLFSIYYNYLQDSGYLVLECFLSNNYLVVILIVLLFLLVFNIYFFTYERRMKNE